MLVVGRDVNQLREMRGIIASALIWSGVLIILRRASPAAWRSASARCGGCASLQAAGADIAGGDLTRRMPISDRRDELDMFAATVNYMMGEVERLMSRGQGRRPRPSPTTCARR